MRATVSLLSCCDGRHSSMVGQHLYEQYAFLPLPTPNNYREALTSSCSDLVDTVLALHSNVVSEQEAVSIREAAERRSQFARLSARSVSAPPRKKWFRSKNNLADGMELNAQGSQEAVCDEFTKKLVAAITTWHDIHSSLLRLSIDRSSESNDDEREFEPSSSITSGYSDEEDDERTTSNNHLAASGARFSISNPDLTNCQIKQMFPEMADHWR